MTKYRELVSELRRQGVLRNPLVERAFTMRDRADFVPERLRSRAYENYPLPIGYGQTISQPFTVAFMLDLLDTGEEQRVLDVGSGSGWTTALLSSIVGTRGTVLGLERVAELVDYGRSNLAKYQVPQASIEPAGPELGRPGTDWDRILVSAAAKKLPQELVLQLKIGGTLVIPVGNSIKKVTRRSLSPEEVQVEDHYGFVFVPLIQ